MREIATYYKYIGHINYGVLLDFMEIHDQMVSSYHSEKGQNLYNTAIRASRAPV